MRVLDSKELKEKINSGEKFIVDMYADWCGPCRVLGKVIEKVKSIPFLIAFKDGKSVTTKVGMVPESQIMEMVNLI